MHEQIESNLDGKNISLNPFENLQKDSGILFSYLNINSLRNKTNSVNEIMLKHVDIFVYCRNEAWLFLS